MNTQRIEGTNRLHVQSVAAGKIDSKALLPASEMSVDGLDDALAVLAALSDKQRSQGERGAKIDIKHHFDVQKRARQEAIEQRNQAREAEKTAGIFKAIAAIGSIAVTAATLGAGAPVALAVTAAALSASSMIVSETKCFGESSNTVATFLGLGSAVVSGGASLAGSASTLSPALQTTTRVISVTGHAAQTVGKAGEAIARHASDEHNIDALREQFVQRREQNAIEEGMASLEDLNKSHARAQAILQEIRSTHQQTKLTAIQTKA